MNFKIDYIFPYCDMTEESFKNDYIKLLSNTEIINTVNDFTRYKDYGFLKYKMKSIYKYMPWINNVYIIVSNKNQIPKFILEDYPKVKIIYHSDFIPKEVLPTFNSNVIELFIPNIKELEEHFIYSNDDIIINNPLDSSDFFTNDGETILETRVKFIEDFNIPLNNIIYQNHINAYNLINLYNYKGFVNSSKAFVTVNHGDKPYIKSRCKQLLDKEHTKILKSCTPFRDTINIISYVYNFNEILNYNPKICFFNCVGFNINSKNINNIIKAFKSNCKTISLDCTKEIEDYILKLVYNVLDKKFK